MTAVPSSTVLSATHQQTTLLGRQDDVATALNTLEQGNFMLLTGPPGVGKSTVLAHLHDCVEQSWLIDLTECQTTTDTLLKLAHGLDLPLMATQNDQWHQNTIAQIELALSHHKDWILFLDNVEHLLTTLLPLIEPWRQHIKLCMGSRLSIEHDELIVQDIKPWTEAYDIAQHPGVMLFQNIARAQGQLWSEAEHLAQIHQLVQHVEGLPLSISLLAARSGMLHPAQMLARFESTTQKNTLTQKLHQTIEWSWQLLDETAQDVLTQCALFRGGFTLDALERIYQDTDIDVFECVEQLRQHALLYTQPTSTHMRGRLLLYIRDFVQKHIQPIHQQRYIDEVGQNAYRHFRKTQGYVWDNAAKHIFDEHENIQHALSLSQTETPPMANMRCALLAAQCIIARKDGNAPLAQSITDTMDTSDWLTLASPEYSMYLQLGRIDLLAMHWQFAQSIEPLKALLKQADTHDDAYMACCVLIRLVSYLAEAGPDHMDESIQMYERGIPLARNINNPHAQMRLLSALSVYYIHKYEFIKATAVCLDAIEQARKLGMIRDEAKTLTNLSYAYQCLGQFKNAHEPMVHAVELFEKSNDIIAIAQTLRMFSWYAIDENRLKEARQAVDKLLKIANQYGLTWINAMAWFLDGQLALAEHQHDLASISLERAIRLFKEEQRAAYIAVSCLYQSFNDELRQDLEQARTNFDAAFEQIDHLKGIQGIVQLKCSRAIWLTRDGKLKAAKTIFDELLAMPQMNNELLRAHVTLSSCFFELAKLETAIAKNKSRSIKKHQTNLLTNLSELLRSPSDDPRAALINRELTLRVLYSLLRQQLPEMLNKRLEIEMQDPNASALIIDLQSKAYRPPAQTQWVDMSNRTTPFKLLEVLIMERLNRPGNPLDLDTLCERVWDEEIIMPEAASNRLYVTISTLRREGLKTLILSEQKGYMLCPDVPLLEVT